MSFLRKNQENPSSLIWEDDKEKEKLEMIRGFYGRVGEDLDFLFFFLSFDLDFIFYHGRGKI